jgi:hypothetical protein
LIFDRETVEIDALRVHKSEPANGLRIRHCDVRSFVVLIDQR